MTLALETRGLEKQFGGLQVTRDLSLKVTQGARHALIGPNGAGKTTVINLSDRRAQAERRADLAGRQRHHRVTVHGRVLRGLSRTFQINQLYPDLTPIETIGLAVAERLGRGGDWWRVMGTRDDVNAEIAENLERFRLTDVMNEPTATLPYGKQRLLEIAVAIATRPRVLLLDEPAAGVPESERHDILAAVAIVAARRHRAPDRARHGPGVFICRPDFGPGQWRHAGGRRTGEVARDPRVKAVYLGEAADG